MPDIVCMRPDTIVMQIAEHAEIDREQEYEKPEECILQRMIKIDRSDQDEQGFDFLIVDDLIHSCCYAGLIGCVRNCGLESGQDGMEFYETIFLRTSAVIRQSSRASCNPLGFAPKY